MWKVRYRTVLAAAAIGSAAALTPLTAGSTQAQTPRCAGPETCFYDQNWYRVSDFDDHPLCTYPDRTEHLGHLELYGGMIDIDGIRTSTGWHRLASPQC